MPTSPSASKRTSRTTWRSNPVPPLPPSRPALPRECRPGRLFRFSLTQRAHPETTTQPTKGNIYSGRPCFRRSFPSVIQDLRPIHQTGKPQTRHLSRLYTNPHGLYFSISGEGGEQRYDSHPHHGATNRRFKKKTPGCPEKQRRAGVVSVKKS